MFVVHQVPEISSSVSTIPLLAKFSKFLVLKMYGNDIKLNTKRLKYRKCDSFCGAGIGRAGCWGAEIFFCCVDNSLVELFDTLNSIHT